MKFLSRDNLITISFEGYLYYSFLFEAIFTRTEKISTECIFPQISEKFFFPLLRLLGISSDSWQMVYKNELTPSDVESSYSTLTLFQWNLFCFSKNCVCFYSSWWHRSVFLPVQSYALKFEDTKVSVPSFSNAHFFLGRGDKMLFWLLHLPYTFVVEGDFFKFIIKSRAEDLLLAMFIGVPISLMIGSCSHSMGQHEVHSMGLIGSLESSNSSDGTG